MEFNTWVEKVIFNDEGKFEVSTWDLINDTHKTEIFTHVVVASGHFSTPNDPKFEGEETFTGNLIHSHDFRRGAD